MKRASTLTLTAVIIFSLARTMAEPSDQHSEHTEACAEGCEDQACAENACAIPSGAGLAEGETVERTEAEWRAMLTPMQYKVLREQGTEPPFNNAYWNFKGKGTFACAGCQAELFSTKEKFDSGTGWPSFYDATVPDNIARTVDKSHGMVRTEVHCSQCGGHLGHLFPDGPKPTGLRYCINSASLSLIESEKDE